jgi:hypothetical protein
MKTITENEKLREDLMRQLSALNAKEEAEREEARLQANYNNWKSRKSVFMLGKAYLDIKNKENLGISVSVPGNAGQTYKVGEFLPSSVVTYYHNVLDDNLRRELQSELTKVVESFVEKTVKSPIAVLEMLALADTHSTPKDFPKDKLEEMKEELRQERFKVLDQFTEEELSDVATRHISHGGSILRDYAKEKGYDLYSSPVKNWLKK